MRLCGRFGFDLERMWWTVGPAEFELLVKGGVERERIHRYGFASIVAIVRSFAGTPTTPEELLGEADEYGATPFGAAADDPAAVYERRQARLRADEEKRLREWMPADMPASALE